MNFELTAEQKAHYQRLLEFSSTSLCDDVTTRDARGEFSEELWDRCAEFGLLRSNVPEEFGGDVEQDLLTSVVGLEALGRGCRDRGLLLAVNVQLWSVQWPILKLGTQGQKERFLPKLCSGEWKGAHALTEPEAGSDVMSLQTSAVKVDGGWVLNGTKCMVSLAPIADLFLVSAKTSDCEGSSGQATFIVERNLNGAVVSSATDKMGLRTIPFGTLQLENCVVSDDCRLGESCEVGVIQSLLDMERCCILASQVGAMEHQLTEAVKYARRRRQFGQSIGSFQSISNRIADMKVRLETSKLLLYRVASLKDAGRNVTAEAAMLKLYLSESFVESSFDAMRIFGGRGYMSEFEVEREVRDSLGAVFYGGTSDIQRNIIAGMLGVA